MAVTARHAVVRSRYLPSNFRAELGSFFAECARGDFPRAEYLMEILRNKMFSKNVLLFHLVAILARLYCRNLH